MQKARGHLAAPTACKRTVSGTISLRCPRCFSPFPHGTGPLSVSRECLALADGAAGFRQDSSGPALLRIPPRASSVSHTGLSPSAVELSRTVPLPTRRHLKVLQPRRCRNIAGLGSAAFAHHYSRYHFCFLFLRLLRCFSSAGSPPHKGIMYLQYTGLPHSEIRGSGPICGYPRLIAACHVLLRLREPRHPPCALGYFTHPNDITFLKCTCVALRSLLFARDFISFLSCLLPSCQRTLPPLAVEWRIRDSNP